MTYYILYVDDNPLDQKIYRTRLEDEGYTVSTLDSVQDARLSISKRTPDLIILDDRLGAKTGVEVCRELRNNPNTQSLPILIFSAYAEGNDRREIEADDAGAHEYLDKGVSRDIFLSKVRKLLDKSLDRNEFCIVSVTLDNAIHFELNGVLQEQGVGHQLEDNPRLRFNEDMTLVAQNLAFAHREWLNSRKNHKNDATYLKKRREWRPHAKNRGEDLYKLLFKGNSNFTQSWGKAQQAVVRKPQNLVLRFSGPRENLTLPFELLHSNGTPLATQHPISRRINDISTDKKSWGEFLRINRGQIIHVLLLSGDEAGVKELELVENELMNCQSVMNVQFQFWRPEKQGPPTMEEADKLLSQKNYHIIHYAGHGEFDFSYPENSALLFSDERLKTNRLHTLLDNSSTQFMFLSCCSGAEIGIDRSSIDSNSNLGLMHAAVRAEVPAVLGFRWPVVERSSRNFAKAFYEGLGRFPFSLEYATWWARKSIFDRSEEGGWDETWFSPILVVQNPDQPAI